VAETKKPPVPTDMGDRAQKGLGPQALLYPSLS
jgi:hypothetical protein